jgi:hypothetical protein
MPGVEHTVPELEPIFQSLEKEIEKEINALKSSLNTLVQQHHGDVAKELKTAVGPSVMQAPTSLPWFKYGLRGFLSKLWYGNHPDNPVWQYHTNQQTQGECVCLDYFSYLMEEIKIATNTIFLEVAEDEVKTARPTPQTPPTPPTPPSAFAQYMASRTPPPLPSDHNDDVAIHDQLQSMINNFHKKIIKIMISHLNKVHELGRKPKEQEPPSEPQNAEAEAEKPEATPAQMTGSDHTVYDAEKILENYPRKARTEYYKILLNAQQN